MRRRMIGILAGGVVMCAGFGVWGQQAATRPAGTRGGVGTMPSGGPIGRLAIPGKVPFTISKETTAIAVPLRADGAVDYLAVINDKYAMGVMVENNGFVVWLQVVGTDILAPKTQEVVLLMSGAKETAAGAEVWVGYREYMKRRLGLSDEKLDMNDVPAVAAYDDKIETIRKELSGAARGLWREEEHPDLAAFIKAREKLLAVAAQAADRPRWWVPAIPMDGRSLLSASEPLLGVDDVAKTLCARAMLRATTGDMAGFLKDIKVVRQLARQVGSEPWTIDRMTGEAIENQATAAMAGWGASGTLTEGQCKTLESALDAFGAMPSMAECVDCEERWRALDFVQWVALAGLSSRPMEAEVIGVGIVEIPSGSTGKIDQEDVDWDVVLKRVNAVFDDNKRVMGISSMKELKAESDAIERQLDALIVEGNGGGLAWSMAGAAVTRPANADKPVDLSKAAAETRAAYTERVTKIILTIMRPNYGQTEEFYRRCAQQTEMVRAVLAAAEVKGRTGKWPAKLEELVPGVLKELPKDMYSTGGTATVKYVVTKSGVRVYTVGPNGKDDGGVNDRDKGLDDIAVGAKE